MMKLKTKSEHSQRKHTATLSEPIIMGEDYRICKSKA